VGVGALLLGIARLLPAEGAGAAVRVAVAALLVLLLPGWLVVARLGELAGLGAALSAAFVWSLAILLVALVGTFIMGGSLTLTVVLVVVVTLAAGLVPGRFGVARPLRADWVAAVAVACGGALLAVPVWLSAGPLRGDALFHVARARKLAELPALDSLRALSEFPDGGVHPGYALPLWQGAIALVSRIAGVDVADVPLRLSAVLVPLALLLAYAAGSALFGGSAGGAATAIGQAGIIQLAGADVTSFRLISFPVAASLLLVVPALLALVFSFVATGARRVLLSVGAAALALAVVHPTYVLFVALPLAGFLVARAVFARGSGEAGRIALAVGVLAASAAGYLLWLLPVARGVAAYTPGERRRAQELVYYADRVDLSGSSFRLDPGLLTDGGIAVVVALLAIPLAALAWRSRWAAYVLGGSLPVLAVALVPDFFSRAADFVSLSQALRIRHLLPLPYALAGAAILLAEALASLPSRLRRRPLSVDALAVALALALVLPIVSLRAASAEPPATTAHFSAGLVEAVRSHTEPRELVISDPITSYRLAAYAPVTILAAPLAHVAQTPADHPYARLREFDRLFSSHGAERARLLHTYPARWLIVDRHQTRGDLTVPGLEPVYDDGRFTLFRINSPKPFEAIGSSSIW
jgi:hypothetical protein